MTSGLHAVASGGSRVRLGAHIDSDGPDHRAAASDSCRALRSAVAMLTAEGIDVEIDCKNPKRVAVPERWVVALLTDPARTDHVLRVAIDEARSRGATIMALLPTEYCQGAVPSAIEALGDSAEVEIWVMPQPDDLVAMLLQSPESEHVVVADADDAAVIHTVIHHVGTPGLTGGLTLLMTSARAPVAPPGTRRAGPRSTVRRSEFRDRESSFCSPPETEPATAQIG